MTIALISCAATAGGAWRLKESDLTWVQKTAGARCNSPMWFQDATIRWEPSNVDACDARCRSHTGAEHCSGFAVSVQVNATDTPWCHLCLGEWDVASDAQWDLYHLTGGGYHLAPAGEHSCDYGAPAPQELCAAAVEQLANAAGSTSSGDLEVGSGGLCDDMGWGDRPLGCSARSGGDWRAFYKLSGGSAEGCIRQVYQLVCTGHTVDATPKPPHPLEPLDLALIRDLLPPPSEKCAEGANGTFHGSRAWMPPHAASGWSSLSAAFESDAFLAMLTHTDADPAKSWQMRIAKGGNPYSFIGPYGEMMPPQHHSNAPFIDEVWQNVAVDTTQNVASAKWFIHQAGAYQTDDLREKPFYSPSLAKYCDEVEKECGFISWGQQAHANGYQSGHESSMLYLTRFKDCGNGVIEAIWGFHNFARNGDVLHYLNIPWAGWRPTVFRAFEWGLEPNASGHPRTDHVSPIPNFGDVNDDSLKYLKNLGGYALVSEDLPLDRKFVMPCSDCNFVIEGSAAESTSHTAAYGLYTIRVRIQALGAAIITGMRGQDIEVSNGKGKSLNIAGILHWAWQSIDMYIYLKPGDTKDTWNNQFEVGDTLSFSFPPVSKLPELNRGFGWVFGFDRDGPPNQNEDLERRWWQSNGRARLGNSGYGLRDFNVFTINGITNLKPKTTLAVRQYMLTGMHQGMDSLASKWAEQVSQTGSIPGDYPGRPVHLFAFTDSSDGSARFGIDLDPSCGILGLSNKNATCVGQTTPQPGTEPLFAIQCGNMSYVGIDPYHFAPPGTGRFAYLCDGMDASVRPSWKLLGYFARDACSALATAAIDPNYCPVQKEETPSRQTTDNTGAVIGGVVAGVVVLVVVAAIMKKTRGARVALDNRKSNEKTGERRRSSTIL